MRSEFSLTPKRADDGRLRDGFYLGHGVSKDRLIELAPMNYVSIIRDKLIKNRRFNELRAPAPDASVSRNTFRTINPTSLKICSVMQ